MAQSIEPSAGGLQPRALAYVLCAYFLFSCTDTGVKYLVTNGMSPPFVSWTRFLGHLLIVGLYLNIPMHPRRLRTRRPGLHVTRALLLFGSGILGFSSLRSLQVPELVSVAFTAPLMISALASILLGEKMDGRRWCAVFVGFIGILIITRPGFGQFHTGHLFAIGAVILYSLFVVLTRQMTVTESEATLLIMPAIVAVLAMLPFLPLVASIPADPIQYAVLGMVALSGTISQWLFVKAYQITTASAVAPYAYTQMLSTLLFSYVVFGQLPDYWTLSGCAVIVCTGLYVMHLDRQNRTRG